MSKSPEVEAIEAAIAGCRAAITQLRSSDKNREARIEHLMKQINRHQRELAVLLKVSRG